MKKAFLLLLITSGMGSIAMSQSLSDSLFIYYRLQGNATDVSGKGNNGFLNGTPPNVSFQGFNGTRFNDTARVGCNIGEYVALPTIDKDFSAGFSFSVWADFNNVDKHERIFDLGDTTGEAYGHNVWFGRDGWSNNVILESWKDNGSSNRSTGRLIASNVITSGTIQHFAGTIEGDSMKIYVNGVLVAKKKGHTVINAIREKSFIAYSNWCFGDNVFSGFIADLRLYNRALSATEITSLYNLGSDPLGLSSERTEGLEIFPNPSSEGYISFTGAGLNKITGITIYDLIGKQYHNEYKAGESTLNTSSLPAGVYILHIETYEGVIIKKVEIK